MGNRNPNYLLLILISFYLLIPPSGYAKEDPPPFPEKDIHIVGWVSQRIAKAFSFDKNNFKTRIHQEIGNFSYIGKLYLQKEIDPYIKKVNVDSNPNKYVYLEAVPNEFIPGMPSGAYSNVSVSHGRKGIVVTVPTVIELYSSSSYGFKKVCDKDLIFQVTVQEQNKDDYSISKIISLKNGRWRGSCKG